MKIKHFIKSNYPIIYPIITESGQFYLSIRNAQKLPCDGLDRKTAGARENLRLSGLSDVRMLLNR